MPSNPFDVKHQNDYDYPSALCTRCLLEVDTAYWIVTGHLCHRCYWLKIEEATKNAETLGTILVQKAKALREQQVQIFVEKTDTATASFSVPQAVAPPVTTTRMPVTSAPQLDIDWEK